MSGLVGVVAHGRDSRVGQDELDGLADDYERLRGGGTRLVGDAGGFARVAKIVPSADGAADPPPGSSWVLASGTVHDRGSSAGMDLADLDGQFAWTSYDAARAEFSLASDPLGMQALYVAERGGKTYFSTSALALAKHLRAGPNGLGLSVFLRAGYQVGPVTAWEGIERLDPGTRITFTERGPTREVYWRPSIDDAVSRLDLGDTMDLCRQVVTDTFRAYLASQPPTWADLTSGYDTRFMTLLLREAGVDFVTNTIINVHTMDARIAGQIARVARWEWHTFELPGDWPETLPKMVPQAVAWGDCHQNALQLAEVLWGHHEKARLHSSLLTGGGGEHFRHVAWQSEFLNAGKSKQVNFDNWVDMVLMWPMNTDLFSRDPSAEVREYLREAMVARAEPYSAHLNTTQLDILHAYRTTGHLGAYRSSASAYLAAELPFYFKPVFDVAISTNYRYRNNHGLMRHMIESLDPKLAALPASIGGPAQPQRLTNLHRFIPYYGKYACKAITKVGQRLIGRALLLPPPIPDELRSAARAAVVDSMSESGPLRARQMRSGPLFEPEALNALLARAGDPTLKEAKVLERILTAEQALRMVDGAVNG
jgi:Glutamine amidotransferase domain